jgi:hypothetical protein
VLKARPELPIIRGMLKLKRPSPALVISLIALFVALGGTGYAAIALPKNSVGAKHIKKNAVTSKKVKNRSLKATDLAAGVIPPGFSGRPAGGDLTGAYPDPTIANGRVTAEKIADGAVGGADLGAGSVDGSKVADGTLKAADVAVFTGTYTVDFSTILANDCSGGVTFPGSAGKVDVEDTVVVTPEATSLQFENIVQPRVTGDDAGFRLCNNSAANHDPPPITVNFTVFDN